MRMTRRPRASSSLPAEADTSPLPRLETTPPVMKMYLGMGGLLLEHLACQLEVVRRVDAYGLITRFDGLDLISRFERSQLFQFLVLLQIGFGQFLKSEKEILVVRIDA